MRQNDPIKLVMSTDLVTATLKENFSELKSLMEKQCVRHVPIVEGKALVGIVSKIDILEYSISKAFSQGNEEGNDKILDPHVTIAELMTEKVTTLKDTDTVKHAVEMFNQHSFHSIPVIDKNNHLVGIVSTDDIMTYLIKQY